MRYTHTDHLGVIHEGQKAKDAFLKVAADLDELALTIVKENEFAAHVTAEQKASFLKKNQKEADQVRHGKVENFSVWQRINTELTGEEIALLP